MSDALNYLLKARPDAMPHYFAFLKQCGTHLDPKTRDLISVITKVHAQTERGFKQYLKRALRDGCSAEEILDALLMAFPTLGFSKIVWAVDQILAMQLPEFERLALGGAASTNDADRAGDANAAQAAAALSLAKPAAESSAAWLDVMPADLAVGATRCADVGGRGVVVHRSAQGWQAYDNRCPHQGTAIELLHVQGASVACPKHGWRFDLASGACIDKGDRPLVRLEAKEEGGRVWVRWRVSLGSAALISSIGKP